MAVMPWLVRIDDTEIIRFRVNSRQMWATDKFCKNYWPEARHVVSWETAKKNPYAQVYFTLYNGSSNMAQDVDQLFLNAR